MIFQIRSDNGFDGEKFKGFLVQARNAADDKAVGIFILTNKADEDFRMQHLLCSEDTPEVIFKYPSYRAVFFKAPKTALMKENACILVQLIFFQQPLSSSFRLL